MAAPLPANLTDQVTAFNRKFGFPVRDVPVDPNKVPHTVLKHRLRLMASEFMEVMTAFGVNVGFDGVTAQLEKAIAAATFANPQVLGGIAQELADLDYTVEGTRLALGIPRLPVAAEVHRANMEKVPPPAVDPVKPEGWRPPQVAELLDREIAAHYIAEE